MKSAPIKRVLIAACVVLTFVFLALTVPIPFQGRIIAAIGDLVHAPLFGGLALVTLICWQAISPIPSAGSKQETTSTNIGTPSPAGPSVSRSPPWTLFFRSFCVWFTLTAFGTVMEWVQSLAGRQMSLHDAFSNSMGIVAAVFAYAAGWFWMRGNHPRAVRMGVTTLMVLAIAWSHPIWILADCIRVKRQFPLLASFESSLSWSRMFFEGAKGKRVKEHATDGTYALETRFGIQRYTFVALTGLLPDWSGFDALEFDAYVQSDGSQKPLRLLIKIFDQPHHGDYLGTFSTSVELVPGRQEHVRLPMKEILQARDGTEMDLTQMGSIEFGVVNPTTERVIYFDRVILTKRAGASAEISASL